MKASVFVVILIFISFGRHMLSFGAESFGQNLHYDTAQLVYFFNGEPTRVACDAYNNVYIVGNTSSGGISTSSSLNGGSDAFIAKFDSNGRLKWSKYFGGKGDDYGRDIAISPNGRVYISGTTNSANNITHGYSWQKGNYCGNNSFLAAYDTSGRLCWSTYISRPCGTEPGYSFPAITTDTKDNVILEKCTFDDVNYILDSGTTYKFDSSGHFMWRNKNGFLAFHNVLWNLATDSLDNIYGTGEGENFLDSNDDFYLSLVEKGSPKGDFKTIASEYINLYPSSGYFDLSVTDFIDVINVDGESSVYYSLNELSRYYKSSYCYSMLNKYDIPFFIKFSYPDDSICYYDFAQKQSISVALYFNAHGSISGSSLNAHYLAVDNNENIYYILDDRMYVLKKTRNSSAIQKNIEPLSSFNIFPNPASAYLNVRYQSVSLEPLSLIIYDFLGRMVYSESKAVNTGQFNTNILLSNYRKGIYSVQIMQAGHTFSKIFSIQ